MERSHLCGIDLDASAVRGAVEEARDVEEHVARGSAVGGDHLLQVGVELPGDVVDRAVRGSCELRDARAHVGTSEDCRAHAGRGVSRAVPTHCTGQFASVSR